MGILHLAENLNLHTIFLSEILDVYLDFVKLIVRKVDSHTRLVPNLLKSFQ